jgi:integrase
MARGNRTTLDIAEKVSIAFGSTVSKMFQYEGLQTGLNPKTIVEHHRLIHAMLNKAVKWQVVTNNVADRAEPPKIARTEAMHYNEEQTVKLFGLIIDEPLKYQVAVYIGALGGLRVGEICGLEWSDIDYENKTLTVNRARQYVPGLHTFDKVPKTERSKRTIELPQTVIDVLRKHEEEQVETRLNLGNQWVDSGKILTQWNGTPMNPQTPSQWFNKFLRRNVLQPITFHQLRHTHASLLLTNGVDIATISKRLGHSKVSVTLDVYSHSNRDRDRAAADKLDSLVNPKRRKESDHD